MLIAAAGLAGSGKTTALEHLASIGGGTYFYVGQIVRTEVASRGLELNPANERIVREALRRDGGKAALAEKAAPDLRSHLERGGAVLIDAIYNEEEAVYYRDAFADDLIILGLDVPFALRAARLAIRRPRAMTAGELSNRDAYETDSLRIDRVLEGANIALRNNGTEAEFKRELRELLSQKFGRG